MRVRDVMTQSAVCCEAGTNVGKAVELMWVHNCGMLPVTGTGGKLEGIITDRDISIAMGTRNRLAGELTVGEIATTKNIITCKPEDEVHEALQAMADKQVRRLPVVDEQSVPQGILSIDDIITHGDLNRWQGYCELSAEEIIRALKRLYGRRRPPSVRSHAAVA
jgi:CBS domain-containing protein